MTLTSNWIFVYVVLHLHVNFVVQIFTCYFLNVVDSLNSAKKILQIHSSCYFIVKKYFGLKMMCVCVFTQPQNTKMTHHIFKPFIAMKWRERVEMAWRWVRVRTEVYNEIFATGYMTGNFHNSDALICIHWTFDRDRFYFYQTLIRNTHMNSSLHERPQFKLTILFLLCTYPQIHTENEGRGTNWIDLKVYITFVGLHFN